MQNKKLSLSDVFFTFTPGTPSFREKIQLKAITKTVAVLALLAWLTSLGLTAFADVIAVTVGTKPGHAYHDALLLKQLSVHCHDIADISAEAE